MIYLCLSILCAASLMLIFKGFNRFKIHGFQAIVINYLVCVLIGCLLAGKRVRFTAIPEFSWWPYAVVLGLLFIAVFYLINLTARQVGATVAAVANKISLVIPVMVAFVLYNDSINAWKVTGLVCALPAVYCVSVRKASQVVPLQGRERRIQFGLPLLVFFGGGLIDSLIKYVEVYHLQRLDYHTFITVLFGTAFITGLPILLWQLVVRHAAPISLYTWVGGVVLGIANYGSIYFLIEALSVPGWESSVIFPVNHVGIVAVAALGAYLLYREHLNWLNGIGLLLAAVTIIFVSIGK